MVGQGSALVARPGGERREQRPLVDQAVLQGQQAEEQVAIAIDGGHDTGLLGARRALGRLDTDDGVAPRAMNRIERIIAWPIVLCSRAPSDRAYGPRVRPAGPLAPTAVRCAFSQIAHT